MNISNLSNLIKVITSTSNNVNYIQSKILDLAFSGSFLPKEIPSPDTWETLRLDEVCEYIQRGKSPKYDEKGEVRVVSQKCVQWSGFNPEHSRYIENSTIKKYTQDRFLRDSDILWNSTGTGTVGRTCIFTSNNDQRKYVADSHVTVLRSSRVFPKFLLYWTRSPKIQDKVLGLTTGSTNQQELNLSTIKSLEISFPSLKYQVLLANHIDGLITLCEELDTCMKASQEMLSKARKSSVDAISTAQSQKDFQIAWKRIEENWKVMAGTPESIESLRNLILTLAISGNLTKDFSPEDTVEELLDKVSKTLNAYPEISDERFAIPSNWKWVSLASVAEHQLGKMLHTAKMKGVRRLYLRSVNVRPDGTIDLTDLNEMLIPEIELEKYNVKNGDLFVNEGGDVGRNAIFDLKIDFELAYQNQLHRLRPVCGIEGRYIQFVLRQAKSQGVISQMSSGVTIQHFSASALRRFAIPLPPLSEQKLIVEKVNHLMKFCDDLERKVLEVTHLSEKFVRSVVSA